jgi:hypothetical protein
MALVYILVRRLRLYAFNLNIFTLFTDLIAPLVPSMGWEAPIIDFKSSVSLFVRKSVCKALVYVHYPVFLKSSFYNRL